MQPTNQPPAPDFGPPPDYTAWPAYQATATMRPAKRDRLKTALGGLALAGLLVVGGAATVFAADPSPNPSTSPNVTAPDSTDDQDSSGTRGAREDCPDKVTTDDTTSTDASS